MASIDLHNKTLLISRTDSIGDVVLTIPLCLWIKKQFPTCKLIFLGNSYTQPVLGCFPAIDKVLRWKEIENQPITERERIVRAEKIDVALHVFPKKEIARLLKKAKIPTRIGTSHRLFHLTTCNLRLNFTRKKSEFHESQLNFELVKPFGLNELPALNEISSWMESSFSTEKLLVLNNFENWQNAIILHPKSQGSALEWPIEKYIELAQKLLDKGEKVVFSGTENEGKLFRHLIPQHEHCFDATGKMTLDEFIAFIAKSKALVACSTGPLHIAGIAGIQALGLFSSRRPIHPGRWKPLGSKAQALVFDENCPTCASGKVCHCIGNIAVEKVFSYLS